MPSNHRLKVGADEVRSWARRRGLPVGTRGRLSRSLVDRFNRAHRVKVHVRA